jgi:hypothetical protein
MSSPRGGSFVFSFFLPFPFSSSTAPQAFPRPDRRMLPPARAGCVKAGPLFSGPPSGSAFTRPSTTAGLMGSVDCSCPVTYPSSCQRALFRSRMCFRQVLLRSPGACDVRINLYPAAPIRLAKVLHAWTIAQEGWGSSFERQIGKRRSAMRTHSHTSDLPDTPTGVSELSALSTLSREGRSLRNQTLLEIAPEGNGELARHCNDHDALDAPVLPFGPLHKPLGNRALGLMLDPQPG